MAAEKPFPGPASAGAGRIGFMGPIQGPLNAAVPEGGPVLGPGWERKPLPNVLAGPPIPPGLIGAAPTPAAVASGNPTSSELPDEKTVALSRLANPQVQVRTAAPTKAETATAENPLTVHVALKDDDFRSGEPVTARVTANIACYAALVLVDSEGKSSTVFQSTRPTREFTCLLKAGPAPGTEYLLAVASLQPLGSVELAPAVRGAASGFAPARVTSAAGHAPPAAWTLAVAHVDNLDGDAKKLQRFEWNTGTATFVTLAPVVTASKPKPKATAAPRDERPQPTPDESTLPKPASVDPKPAEKPAAPSDSESVLPK